MTSEYGVSDIVIDFKPFLPMRSFQAFIRHSGDEPYSDTFGSFDV
jgi:hypothetical protein